MSTAEAILWRGLRRRGTAAKFRRQFPMGPYVADFACMEVRLMIEIDGPAHDAPEQKDKDVAGDTWLTRQRWRVLRFSSDAVLTGSELVLAEIKRQASRRPSSDPAAPGHLLPLAQEKGDARQGITQ
ncbi:endonuclease domain-containing protein [Hyphomicrobiales bacterium BP6-180914]|uniref:Endonuclease domain-containing protein n=2 Tax=Lichenifustis flavocetrariae TaxID=2949735 RepID=A0AA41YSC7_9HYPH|nr:endonuclease domain-containing protein [Lichenifustis flavocetrariae]